MRLSDMIAGIIQQILDDEDGMAEIQRNELAEKIGCVPSQINYVITSRFTPEQGYLVESRRGGGGFIRITRVKLDHGQKLMHVINSIGTSLDRESCRIFIENLSRQGLVSDEAAILMSAALSDKVYRDIPYELRDRLRACIFKQMLISILEK